ncbi:tail fiber domain-containing protein [Hymenobacter negativus]|uniref:Tail fiber domain-containing protein n=1 Tax=Hymenobacter negativus TaxID=2795026 RepID=A0ABS3QKA2_9BACT|nr:tail fiber domain-containing protein [Hymenobacter negativus]MBO2011674.1 tail fiber domain-containing protein [Hymenobacter negativus]
MKAPVLLATALLLTTPAVLRAQSVGIGTTTPASSAVLDVSAPNPATTPQGFLPPRLTKTQREAIQNPVPGLLVYQTDSPAGAAAGLYLYGGSSWTLLPTAASGDNLGNHVATQNIVLNGNQLVGGTAATPGTVGLRVSSDGLVRIGSTSTAGRPAAGFPYGLRLDNADAGLLATGNLGYGIIPASGAGLRLMWHPYKAALRAGEVSGAQWDDANVGFYSQAFGNNVTASSFATFASGDGSTASGTASTAMGSNNTASGTGSVALGAANTASGFCSLAAGYTCRAAGQGAVALGYRTNALNDYSVALGQRSSSNGFTGTFVAADASSTNTFTSTASNQFAARYVGGYRLFTNINANIGVQIAAGGNSWTVISDSTKKERVVLADGNRFLERINRLRLGSWNYRGQDPGTMRHYGPMAQDFYQAFGRDAVGRIGNDSTINQADFDGVNLIAIQALYRQVLALQQENARLREQVRRIDNRSATQPAGAATAAADLEERLRRLEALLSPQAQR